MAVNAELLNEVVQRSVTRQAPIAEREAVPIDPQLAILNQPERQVNPAEYQRRNATAVNQGQSALNEAMQRRLESDRAGLEALQGRMSQQLQKRIVNVPLGNGQFRGSPKIINQGQGSSKGTGNGSFDKFMNAISSQESGGKYGIVNRDSGAMGKYQIMPGNIRGAKRGWDYDALGRDVSTQEFLSNPQIQEAIARHKMQQYYNKYGARGAAIAWYAGPGAVNYKNLNKSQGKYPSINSYADSILRRLGLA